MVTRTTYPWFIEPEKRGAGGRWRAWQRQKRKEMDVALSALDVVLCGSAYLPSGNEVCTLRELINDMQAIRRNMRKSEWK